MVQGARSAKWVSDIFLYHLLFPFVLVGLKHLVFNGKALGKKF